jgi:ATP-dependent helicase/nuclease subunit B
LQLLDPLLADRPDDIDRLCNVFGTNLTAQAEPIEDAQKELELLTGGRQHRQEALRDVAQTLEGVHTAQALDYLAGTASVKKRLQQHVDTYLSTGHMFQAAAEAIERTDGAVWEQIFAGIERVHLAGASMIGSPLLDLLDSIAHWTPATVHLHLRGRTGPQILSRLETRLTHASVAHPEGNSKQTASEALSVDATEIVAQTRQHEARSAVALIDALLEAGVPPSDILVVARDVDTYERALRRAGRTYGRQFDIWSQLQVTQTLPYRLVVAICTLLTAADDTTVTPEVLLRPLETQWVHPCGDHDNWPLDSAELAVLRSAVDESASRTLAAWQECFLTADSIGTDIRNAMISYLQWCREQPTVPEDPDDITNVLIPVIEAFNEVAVPQREAADGAAYVETARIAKAVERVGTADSDTPLLVRSQSKYADWLQQGYVSQSWQTVRTIMDMLAQRGAGRRAHNNAEQIDVLDANNTWLRSAPYVIALGLVDSEWPQSPRGSVPTPLRTAIASGGSAAARQLPVRGSWTPAREADHFLDMLQTPTKHLIVTRYTTNTESVTQPRSPLLRQLSTTKLSTEERQRLLSPKTTIPDPIPIPSGTNTDEAGADSV